MAHTPGPWTIPPRAENTRASIPVSSESSGRTICNVRLNENDLSNARLIAAAPDLLQACEKARDACEGLANTDTVTADDVAGLYETLSAAIAKAKGGQP